MDRWEKQRKSGVEKMSRVIVVTDSNSGITQSEAKELGVVVMPMPFYINGQMFYEDIDLTQEQFYQKLKEGGEIKTSMPLVGDVTDKWDELLKEYDEIVYIPMSSGLSSSCETAYMLSQDYDGKVQVVNNQRISVTMRQSVLDAKMLAEQGKGAEEIKEILEKENIFVMDESRASHQDIRPIQILILNLMPLKEETELQLLRSLSNTPLQVDVTFMAVQSHEAKNTSVSHLNKFYQTFPELKNNKYDGMIITGAPVEQMEFEEVDYWKELVEIMDWTNTHVTSTIYLCWAAQAGLYHHYGLKKRKLDKKMFGLFWHKVMNRKIPLVRGFDDMFLAPHSRHTEVPIEDIHNCKELTVLAESDEAGLFLAMADGGRKIFVMGHPEYDRVTLDGEYKRDVSKNLPIEIPENYYKDNNPENRPLLMWRAHANNLYTNWLNYYVYQSTPFDLYGTPDFSEI